MSPKKDGPKPFDILEKMKLIKPVDEEINEPTSSVGISSDDPFDALLENEVQTRTVDVPPVAPPPEFDASIFTPPTYPETPESPFGIPDTGMFTEESSATDTDQYQALEELYEHFNMQLSGVSTIYLIESYMKTLPDTLPAELRRSIILQIVDASQFDFNKLLGDGFERVEKLNKYSAVFAARTEELVERHNVEIETLERQIQQIRERINERKNLHKRQFLTLETEAQRLRDILDFITK